MEDQGVQRPQTFLVKKFLFLQWPRKHEERNTFKDVLTTDHRFKAAFRGVLKTKTLGILKTPKFENKDPPPMQLEVEYWRHKF